MVVKVSSFINDEPRCDDWSHHISLPVCEKKKNNKKGNRIVVRHYSTTFPHCRYLIVLIILLPVTTLQ